MIEYSDYAVGRSIQAVIDEWVKGMRFDDKEVVSASTAKTLERAANALVFVIPMSALASGILLEVPTYVDLITPARYLLAVIFVSITALTLAIFGQDKTTDYLSILRPGTSILLTAGDIRRREWLLKRRKNAKMRVGLFLSGGILAFLVAILANYVSAQIFSAN